MAFKEKQRMVEYNNAYNKENYDRITIMAKKGWKDKLRYLSEITGESVNSLILTAIREKYHLK